MYRLLSSSMASTEEEEPGARSITNHWFSRYLKPVLPDLSEQVYFIFYPRYEEKILGFP